MFFVFLVFVCVLLVVYTVNALLGLSKVTDLASYKPSLKEFPKVSILVACRNEGGQVAAAAQTWLRQDYPSFEIIAVNDRSTDDTEERLNEVAAKDDRLQVRNIRTLPDGWLGKNHALWAAAKEASGETLLFTDADVRMQESTLKKSVGYLLEQEFDHVAVLPKLEAQDWVMELCVATFVMLLNFFLQPWKVRDPKSTASIGVGAFNLVKKKAYFEAGGHERIRLRPDDDIKLGLCLKKSGFRQDCSFGGHLMEVLWYPNFGNFMRGLEKNVFAATDYKLWVVFLSSFMLFWFYLFPLYGVFLGPRYAIVEGIQIGLPILLFYFQKRYCETSFRIAPLFPLGILLYNFVCWRAVIKNYWTGGIEWRGTFYSLRELKKNKI